MQIGFMDDECIESCEGFEGVSERAIKGQIPSKIRNVKENINSKVRF